jgi:TatD DNase family protein
MIITSGLELEFLIRWTFWRTRLTTPIEMREREKEVLQGDFLLEGLIKKEYQIRGSSMTIDSHAHLEMGAFNDDREAVITRAKKAGITGIITIGVTLADSEKGVDIAGLYDIVYASVGVHPHEVNEIGADTYDRLRTLARREKVVAVGEIGLDFYYNHSPKDLQFRHFADQLDLAVELNLPVVIHDREAHLETLEFLGYRKGRLRGVLHCFSGDLEMAKKCVDMGFTVSIAGPITYKKSEQLQEVAREIPLEKMLIETDAPYLAPQPWRGKRNEPAYVIETARRVAEIRGITAAEVELATEMNARRLFGLQ